MKDLDKLNEQEREALSRREFIKRSSMSVGMLGLPAMLATACGSNDDGDGAEPSPTSPGAAASALPTAQAWRFGIMSDTQWVAVGSTNDDGRNPHSCAVDIIRQLNTQFIAHGVKFVVQVGDLCDKGTSASFTQKKSDGSSYASSQKLAEDIRAAFTQDLFNAGIGFFPLRGNHDDTAITAAEFQRIFPQTQSGAHNTTPADVLAVANPDADLQALTAKSGSAFSIGSDFNSPSAGLKGLSYSFDHANARFILLDQFTPTDSLNADGSAFAGGKTIAAQQSWIGNRLSSRPAGSHAFVFSHKGLLTQDHTDVLFGDCSAPGPITIGTSNYTGSPGMDAFIASLQGNNCRLFVCGHDHMHDRSVVATMDGSAKVTQVVGASNSNKFYYPASPSNDATFSGGKRQTLLSQERNTVGYYIVTVDGANVTVDFYSAPSYPTPVNGGTMASTPTLNFSWRERFGYSLAGKEFIVAQMASYTGVADTGPGGTVFKILDGANGNTALDVSNRPYVVAVNTGWFAATAQTASDVLLLQGMDYAMGSRETDPFVVSLSYDSSKVAAAQIAAAGFGLASVGADGKWIRAVALNSAGKPQYIKGPWKKGYVLGTWGVDEASKTVWGVVNHNGYFAAVANI